MLKNQKGITLIALVITIIVLLILAGVSIAMLTGDNGILTRASESKTETTKAEVVERVNMELNAQMANAMAGLKFDSATTIESNIGDLPTGYSVSVTFTPSGDPAAYSTSTSLSIAITAPSGVTLTTSTGTVAYVSNAWKVTPTEK